MLRNMSNKALRWTMFLMLLVLLATIPTGLGLTQGDTPTETPTASSTDIPTVTPTDTPIPTATETATEIPPTEVPSAVPTASETPTDIPSLTPTAESTESASTPEATLVEETASPTATATNTPDTLPAEPPLTLLVTDNFDSGSLILWTLGSGWSLVPNESGQALSGSGDSEPVRFVHDTLFNIAVQGRFLMDAGTARLSVRSSSVGSYSAALDSTGQITLYRGETAFASGITTASTSGQWRTLRLSVMNDILRVSVDDSEVIAIRDSAPLPPGTITFSHAGQGTLIVDDVTLWSSGETLPAAPTETPSPTATATAATPDLPLIASDNFDADQLTNWSAGPGWSLVPNNGGNALSVSNSTEGIVYGLNAYADIAVQIRVRLDKAPIRLTIRQSDTGNYSVSLAPDGQVSLYRSNDLLNSVKLSPTPSGQWNTLRLSALRGVLRVVVDNQQVIQVSDPAPLPQGRIVLSAPETVIANANEATVSQVLIDDFEIRGSTSAQAAVATSTVGDWVWEDTNADGLQSPGEVGVPNVLIRIYKQVGSVTSLIGSTTTNASGYYSFTKPGNQYYIIEVVRPTGYDFTSKLSDTTYPYTNSDFDPFTGLTPLYYLYAGYTYLSVDAGLVKLYDCDTPIDMMVVIDGSGSINASDFNLIKGFTRGLADSFAIGPTSARLGIAQFATTGAGKLHLPLSDNRNAILDALNKITQLGGLTDIQEGIHIGQLQLASRGRPAPMPRALILLTDGEDTENSNPVLEAFNAKNSGTVVYVVAVGSAYITVINDIASDPDSEHVFAVTGLQELIKALYALSNATCNTPSRPLAPRLLSPLNGYLTNDSAATLFDWTAVATATQYEVQFDDDSKFGSPLPSKFSATDSLSTFLGLIDKTYYWRVRGLNGNVPGAWSVSRSFIVDTIAPLPPVLAAPLDKAGVNNFKPTLSWAASATANLYRLQVSTDNTFGSPLVDVTQTALTKTLTTALAYGRYYWRVQARDVATNWSAWSTVRSFDVTIMKSPVNGAWTTITQPNFQWYSISGGTGYQLEVSTNPDFSGAHVVVTYDTASGLSTTLTTPLAYGVYYWRVNWNVGAGLVTSPVYWVLTITPATLKPPVLRTPANTSQINDTTPTLSWDAVVDGANAVSYEIQIGRVANLATYLQDTIVTTTSTTASLLSPNGLYYWRARTLNYLNIPGVWSPIWSFTLDTVAPLAPVLTAPLNYSTSTLTKPVFRWAASATAVRYEMLLGITYPPTVTVYNGAATTFTPISPLLRRTYYWEVRAFDAAGNASPWSTIWTVYITSPTTDYPMLNRFVSSTPTLTWTLISWATGYEIWIDDNSNFSSPIYKSGALPANPLSHTVTIPLPIGTWYWQIRALNGANPPGPWSPASPFTVEY